MSLLYPIIRRVRRPLVPVNPGPKAISASIQKAPVAVPSAETVTPPSSVEVKDPVAETPKKSTRAKKATEPGD